MLDLTFSPSFKVKRWFTGFGELSFRWIQICIGSPMHRSSIQCDVLFSVIQSDLLFSVSPSNLLYSVQPIIFFDSV